MRPLFVRFPAPPGGTSAWTVDATSAGVDPNALDALPWERAFTEMRELEAGAIANPDEGRQVGHYWLRAPELAPTVGQAEAIGASIEAVRAFADGIKSGALRTEAGERFTDAVLVGIGGSALGPELVQDALGDPSRGLGIWFLDNTDPDGIAKVLNALGKRLDTALAVIVSKSGGTPETRNGMLLVEAAFRARGIAPGGRMVAVTGEGSNLDKYAVQNGWARRFAMWDWVGGRTSVTSAVGLVPAELGGVDTAALLAGARAMDEWTRTEPWRDNPAAILAGCWHAIGGGRGDKAMVVLPYSDRLVLLSRYLQQLVMESLGKRLDRKGNVVHAGISVYGNKGSTDQHAYVQQLRDGRADFFATFVEVFGDGAGSSAVVEGEANAGDFLQGFLLGTRRALRESGRPSITIAIPAVDAFALGGLVALFERAVGLYASLIDVNAYHQPGVEAGKKAAADVLRAAAALRAAANAEPGTAEQLAARVGVDPIDAWHILERFVATARLGRDGDDVYRARKAWE